MRATLKHDSSNCLNCPLYQQTNRPYVPTDLMAPGAMNADSVDILFIGEAPGRDEDKLQLPFVGASGQLLRKALDKYVGDLSYGFANVVRCRPTEDGANRPPSEIEIGFCNGYVRADIAQLKPKVVVLLGGSAIAALNPDPTEESWVRGKVTKARTRSAKEHECVKYVATLHPAYVLRSPQQSVLLETDLSKACNLARGFEDINGEKGESICLDTVSKVERMRDDILNLGPEGRVGFDTETANLNRVGDNRVLSWQFAWGAETGYVVPYHHKLTPFSSGELDQITAILQELFSSKEAAFAHWLIHNAKFDVQKVQRFLGIKTLNRPIFDTMFTMYLHDENRTKLGNQDYFPYALKTLVHEFLGFYHYDNEAVAAREGRMEDLPWDKFIEYGGMDGYVLYRLADRILELAGRYAPRMSRFATRWHSRLAHTLPEVEGNGIWTDKRQLFRLQGENSPIIQRMAEIPEELKKIAEVKATNKYLVSKDGRTAGMKTLFGLKEPWLWNIEKKDHNVALFFEVMELEPIGYGKVKTVEWPEGIPSVDKNFYDAYDDVEIAQTVKEYVGLKKLKSSYINSIIGFVTNHPDMQDGRIRSSQVETRAVTGRLATKDPNTSQIPRADNPAKQEIKSMFASPPGWCMMETDYRQAEVRWWCQIAGDEEFAKLFWNMLELRDRHLRNPGDKELAKRVVAECDIHRQVAALMHGVPIQDVTKAMRQAAKNITFGSIFGQHSSTLARKLGISEPEAKALQDKFLLRFRKAAEWLHEIEVFAEAHGFVETPMGRRRHLAAEFQSGIPGVINRAKRQARNSPIQGSSSDMMLLAGCLIQDYIWANNKDWKLINLVHDATYTEYKLDLEVANDITNVVGNIMTQDVGRVLEADFGVKLIVPFEIEFKIGTRMGHMHAVDANKPLETLIEELKLAA